VTGLDRVFDSVRRDAFRLETRRRYDVPDEVEPFRRWLAGEPDDLGWHEPWLARVRAASAAGITYRRVRLVDEPPSDYQRWCVDLGRTNVAAGEDIRYLPRSTAAGLGVPVDVDWWIVDDVRAAVMRFAGDRLVGLDLVDDVAEYRRWRDLLWAATTPARYGADHTT
jgi:hypothetical protein